LIWINARPADDLHHAPEIPNRASSRRAMEIIYFTLTAIVLYVVSDWALKRMEAFAGRRFEHRSLIFFGIILVLALVSFALIRSFTGT
jgi:hypothetical protein